MIFVHASHSFIPWDDPIIHPFGFEQEITPGCATSFLGLAKVNP
jgi:hypothetical protein